jgi:hypothetical protein
MDERPSVGFWIAGTLLLLVFAVPALLPLIFFMCGAKYVLGGMVHLGFFIYEWAVPIAGTLAGGGLILLIVRLVNRRRSAP